MLIFLLTLELGLISFTSYNPLFGVLFLVPVTCLGLFLLLEKYPEHSITIIIFSILLGSVSTITMGRKIPQLYFVDLALLLVCFILVLRYLMVANNFRVSVTPVERLFFVFLVYLFLTILQSVDFLRGLASLRIYIVGWLIFGFTLKYIKGAEQIRRLFWSLMIWGLLLSLIQIHHVLVQGNILITVLTKNIHLSWGSSNYIAAFYALLIPMGISMIFIKKLSISARLLLISVVLLMITALFLTGSRGGVVAFCFGSLVLLWRFRSWQTLLAFLFFCFLMGCVIFSIPSSQIIWQGLVGYQTSPSVLSRVELWKESIRIFMENPILGVGLGNINYHVELAGSLFMRSHNLMLELLSEAGIIGFLIFVGLILKILRIQIKNCAKIQNSFHHSLAWGVLAATIAALAHSMVEPNISSYMFALIFWTIIGISIKQKELIATI